MLFMRNVLEKCDIFQEYMEYLFSPKTILKYYEKEIHTIFFYESIHNFKTLALGYLCMQDIEKIYEFSHNIFLENDKLNRDLVLNLCDSYNKAIKGFI